MGKSSPSAPAAPDPVLTANAQASANKDTAIAQSRLNQIDEFSPYGSAVYSPTGQKADGIDLYKRTVSLSPAQQSILDLQNNATQTAYGIGQHQLGQIGDTLSHPLDFSGLPTAPTGNDAYRQQVQDALYGRATAQLDPMYQDRQRALETQLANEGFARGGEGYTKALDRFDLGKNNDYQNALWSSITNSGNAAQQQFGQETTARQNALAEMLQQRAQPVNELAALLGTSSGIQSPQFSANAPVSVAATDVAGPTYASYNAQLGQYNQQRAQQNALTGSIFGLAGSALGGWLSSRDLKDNITPISDAEVLDKVRAMPVSEWSYKGSPERHIGPMSQDFAEAFGGRDWMIDAPTAFGVSIASVKALADRVDQLEQRHG